MRFVENLICTCGGKFSFIAVGDEPFGTATCSQCETSGGLFDHLSVSVTADRMLHHSKSQLQLGDFTLTVIESAIAVETFLRSFFLKVNKMNHFAVVSCWPTDLETTVWEEQYSRMKWLRKRLDFVSQMASGKTFDRFVEVDTFAMRVVRDWPACSVRTPAEFIQKVLFNRRNQIVHTGYVSSTKEDGELCHRVAVDTVSILRRMDWLRYQNQ